MSNQAEAEQFIKTIQTRLTTLLVERRPFRFTATKQSTAQQHLKKLVNFQGLSFKEIEDLELHLSVKLPEVFKAYLRTFGKSRGDMFRGSDVRTDSIPQYRQWADALIKIRPIDIGDQFTNSNLVGGIRELIASMQHHIK